MGVVVVSVGSETGVLFEFDSFESHEKSFSVVLYFIEDGDRVEPEKIEGFLRDEILCFDLSDNESENKDEVDPPMCFTKYKAINKLRKQADKALKKHRKKRKL